MTSAVEPVQRDVKLGRQASRELLTIRDRLMAQDPVAAQNIITAIAATIDLPRQFPFSGRVVAAGDLRRMPVVRYDYLAFYRVKSTSVFILRVRHSSRRPLRIK